MKKPRRTAGVARLDKFFDQFTNKCSDKFKRRDQLITIAPRGQF